MVLIAQPFLSMQAGFFQPYICPSKDEFLFYLFVNDAQKTYANSYIFAGLIIIINLSKFQTSLLGYFSQYYRMNNISLWISVTQKN